MPAKYFPTSGHLLLCQHQNCRARGADLLMLALARALEQEKLLYYKAGGSVRLTGSGCLGACGYGAVLACYRSVPASGDAERSVPASGDAGGGPRSETLEQGWYEAVTLPLAVRIARAVHEGSALPDEQKYGPT